MLLLDCRFLDLIHAKSIWARLNLYPKSVIIQEPQFIVSSCFIYIFSFVEKGKWNQFNFGSEKREGDRSRPALGRNKLWIIKFTSTNWRRSTSAATPAGGKLHPQFASYQTEYYSDSSLKEKMPGAHFFIKNNSHSPREKGLRRLLTQTPLK